MPKRPADTAPGHHTVTATLTDEEIGAINATRSPSARLKPRNYCGAQKPNGMGPCKDDAGAGTDHKGWGYCKTHGGCTKDGKKHAARLQGEEFIAQRKAEITRFGGDRNDPSIRNITAEQALLEEVRRSVAMVRWLEEQIGQWDYGRALLTAESEIDLDGMIKSDSSKGKMGVKPTPIQTALMAAEEEAAENPDLYGLPSLTAETSLGTASATNKAEWLRLYREERMHSSRVAKMCIDAGIAHRMVSIAEDQGRILATALRVTLGLLALNQEQSNLVPQIVPPILRAVASGQPIPEDLPRLALPKA